MSFKLQRRLDNKKERLFYVIFDTTTREYLDIFEFKRFEVAPNLEREFFKLFVKTIDNLFEDEKYNFVKLKNNMFLINGINIAESQKIAEEIIKNIEYKTSKLLKEIYNLIRWRDLYNLINTFKQKTTFEGVESLHTYILGKEYNTFSYETKQSFENLIENIGFKGNRALLFKEILEICMYDEIKARNSVLIPADARLKKLIEEVGDNEYLTPEQAKEFMELQKIFSPKS